MKRIATLLCFLALLTGQKNFANSCTPCFNWCDLGYSVYADYLYWKAAKSSNVVSVILDSGPFVISDAFLPAIYSSGYRVGGSIYYDCLDFAVRYTSLKNAASVAESSPSTLPFVTLFNSFAYRLNFQTLDLQFGYTYCFPCHRGYLKPFLGAKLAWIRETFNRFSLSSVSVADFTSKYRTNAYGPMVGIEGSWELFRCWLPVSLIARADVSVLDAKSKVNITSNAAIDNFRNENPSFVVAQDIYLGLGFDLCPVSCLDSNIQIGYEAQRWTNLNQFDPRFQQELGLGGLVVHFALFF